MRSILGGSWLFSGGSLISVRGIFCSLGRFGNILHSCMIFGVSFGEI